LAKTLVEDLEETRIPFLRGILIRSLQDAGLEFKEASHIASEIRNELADTALISTVDLNHMVHKRLTSLKKENVVYRYENRNAPLTVEVEQQCGRVNPFSRLKFRNSLETIGLNSRESDDVVQMLQEHPLNPETWRC
jgi:2-phosphoglycerate kinase